MVLFLLVVIFEWSAAIQKLIGTLSFVVGILISDSFISYLR